MASRSINYNYRHYIGAQSRASAYLALQRRHGQVQLRQFELRLRPGDERRARLAGFAGELGDGGGGT